MPAGRRWFSEVEMRFYHVMPARRERGMTTAEYAVGTVAAASFAALLIKLLSSEEVRKLLMNIVKSALDLAG